MDRCIHLLDAAMSMRSSENYDLLCTKIGPNHREPILKGKGSVRARVLAKYASSVRTLQLNGFDVPIFVE